MEAVQQRTSQEVHMSHSSGPKIQSLLICNEKSKRIRSSSDYQIISGPGVYFKKFLVGGSRPGSCHLSPETQIPEIDWDYIKTTVTSHFGATRIISFYASDVTDVGVFIA